MVRSRCFQYHQCDSRHLPLNLRAHHLFFVSSAVVLVNTEFFARRSRSWRGRENIWFASRARQPQLLGLVRHLPLAVILLLIWLIFRRWYPQLEERTCLWSWHGKLSSLPIYSIQQQERTRVHPCHYDDKIFLKGDETALLPIASTSDNCIQWHFVQTDEGDSESLWDLIKKSGDVMTDMSHIRNLSEKRMFVGYWPNAEIHLGTRTSGFRSVELSGAQYNDKNRIILGDEITGTFGTSGMGFFTAEVSATVQIHQTANRRIMAAHKRIHDKIRNAKQASTLIYDVGTKRAWLVPELSVVLHMILAWASYQDQAEDVLEKMQLYQ